MVSKQPSNRIISGGQFAVKLVGQFTVKQGGFFILKRGGQLHCNIHCNFAIFKEGNRISDDSHVSMFGIPGGDCLNANL